MSDTTPGLLHRLNHTPLSDLLRGRVTNRLDLSARLAASSLSDPVRELIGRIVRRTGLWRSERLSVADELTAHFLDGHAAGETFESLLERFGDEKQAAKLIRRAKKRNRPLWYQVLRRGCQAINLLVILYLLAVGWFWIGKPSPSVDYVAQLNEPILSTPPDQRAWPAYRAALQRIKPDAQDPLSDFSEWNRIRDARPGDEAWPAMRRWLESHQQDLEAVREAASRPILGYIWGADGSANDLLTPELVRQNVALGLALTQQPHLGDMRLLAQLLASDAALTREQRDAIRLPRDIDALLGMARQMHADGDQFLIGHLVGIGIYELALEAIDQTLQQAPDLLSEADLTAIAHALSRVSRASDVLSFRGERMFFYDLLQRMYTDDGEGNGRLTPEGIQVISTYSLLANSKSGGGGIEAEDPGAGTIFAGAAAMLATASRQDLRAAYDGIIDRAEARLAKSARAVDWRASERAITTRADSMTDRVRYWPIVLLTPSLERVQWTAERLLGRQDGVLVGIALELHRRRHGRDPAALSELTPHFLPAVPADRITGEPVKYRLVDGRPVVYSVGTDRQDDGGLPPRAMVYGRSIPQSPKAAQWVTPSNPADAAGDWILYPIPMVSVEAPAE